MASEPLVSGPASGARRSFDPLRVRQDFPILAQRPYGLPLAYLDNAASSQKPRGVIDAMTAYYESSHANVHRGLHYLSERATSAYDAAREKVRRFINAAEAREIIFVRGTTEGINLVAQSFGRSVAGPGDEILITEMEHHSNIVPWQMVCDQTGATLRVVPMTDDGELDLEAFDRLLSPSTKLFGVVHISNALGTVNPIKELVARAHAAGVPVLIDGAQSMQHGAVDVQDLDCDFFVCSGHKMFGPTGIGVLYGKAALLERMPPYQGGGDMIEVVSFTETTYARLPAKFEAGTPAIAEAVGLGATVDYLQSLDFPSLATYERELLQYATERVTSVDGVRVIGTAKAKAGVLSFVMDPIHPHDIGTVLDREGVAVRAGHHCAQPVMEHYGVPATVRASFALYNTKEEVDALVRGLNITRELLA
jgi:cysteine desulfurase/selenocysteine lyase